MIKTVSLKLIQKAGIHFVKLFDRKRKTGSKNLARARETHCSLETYGSSPAAIRCVTWNNLPGMA
jgi:hypothetical protein